MNKARRGRFRKRCPSENRLLEFLRGGTGASPDEKLRSHISFCPLCRQKLELLIGLDCKLPEIPVSAVPETQSGIREIRRLAGEKIRAMTSPSLSPLFPAFTAASAFFVFVAFFVLIQPRLPDNLRWVKDGRLNLLEPSGVLKELPTAFRWTPLEEADIYTFKLMDDELETLLEKTKLRHTTVPITEKIKALLEKEVTYIWIVEAFDDVQTLLQTSRKYFRLEEDPQKNAGIFP